MDSYTWIDIYQEFASKLLEYKDDRKTLIDKLDKTFQDLALNLPRPNSEDFILLIRI